MKAKQLAALLMQCPEQEILLFNGEFYEPISGIALHNFYQVSPVEFYEDVNATVSATIFIP
jgi:hypothetical protein